MKGASSSGKAAIWKKIFDDFRRRCEDDGTEFDKNEDSAKKKIKNLEFDFKAVMTKMTTTGQEGALKLKASFDYFDALNEFLGERDAIIPERMTIMSSDFILNSPASDETNSNSTTHDNHSDSSQGKESAESSFSEEPVHQGSDQPSTSTSRGATLGRKRAKLVSEKTPQNKKRKQAEDPDEDPYLARVCDLWQEAMGKQEERFNRPMQLQEKAIAAQTEQTKELVSGLKDILKGLTNQ